MAYSCYVGSVINREIAQCYYFAKTKPIKNPDGARMEEYLDHWNWRSMIECDTPYTDMFTRFCMQTLGYMRIHSSTPLTYAVS